MRVDNEIADQLFKGEFETQQRNWFKWEAETLLDGSAAINGAYQYYTELYEYNNIPCLSYVSKKLDSIAMHNHSKHISAWPFFRSVNTKQPDSFTVF